MWSLVCGCCLSDDDLAENVPVLLCSSLLSLLFSDFEFQMPQPPNRLQLPRCANSNSYITHRPSDAVLLNRSFETAIVPHNTCAYRSLVGLWCQVVRIRGIKSGRKGHAGNNMQHTCNTIHVFSSSASPLNQHRKPSQTEYQAACSFQHEQPPHQLPKRL